MFHVPTWAYVPWLAVKGAAKTVKWLVLLGFYTLKYWWATVPTGVLTYVWWTYGWPWAAGLAFTVATALTAWWNRYPQTFWRTVGWLYLAKWRHMRLYAPLWQATITNTGLAISFDGQRFYPTIVKVRRDGRGDLVTVRMLPGQHPEDWVKAAPRFAHTFHALACEVTPDTGRVGRIVLRFRDRDAFVQVVKPFPAAKFADVRCLPVAIDEDGNLFTVSLTGHVLFAGRTGSGKSSGVWSLIGSLAPSIKAGLVAVHALDPKGGMELAYGAPMFTGFHYDNPEQMAGALEDLAKVVNDRAARYRGISRDHRPTMREPAIVIVVDEFATLTAYVGDRKVKDRINHVMPEILTKGRAIGVYVVAALQDPRKEILGYRNLFGTRIALALNEESEVDMLLGDGAVKRGAAAHLIPASLPGVAYVMTENRARPARVRFPYHNDDQIRAMAEQSGKHGSHGSEVIGR
jgi:S-DNA-T family DNA segregation ATPase FtsK/SpoIIIE